MRGKKLWLTGKLSDFSDAKNMHGPGEGYQANFFNFFDCVKTRKHKMTYLFQGASSSIFTTVRIRNLFLVASVQRDALFKARISQIVYLS